MLINAGGQGIWLFFALSGYLIAGPFVRALARGESLPGTGRYALRRAARILPAYWIALATLLLLVPLPLDWWQVPLHGALLHNLVPGEGQALFFVAWTLGIEALFYAFVPLAAWVARRVAGRGRSLHGRSPPGARALGGEHRVVAVGGGGVPERRPVRRGRERRRVPPVAPRAALGLLPGDPRRRRAGGGSPLLARRAEPLLAAALMLAAAALLLNTTSSTVLLDASRQVWAIAAGLVLVAALAGWGRLGPAVRVLAPIGLVSYGLYLWHWVALKVLLDEGASVQAGFVSWPLRIAVLLAVRCPSRSRVGCWWRSRCCASRGPLACRHGRGAGRGAALAQPRAVAAERRTAVAGLLGPHAVGRSAARPAADRRRRRHRLRPRLPAQRVLQPHRGGDRRAARGFALRRRRRDLPRIIAYDHAGTALLVCVTAGCSPAG